jgi:hypothetical protein
MIKIRKTIHNIFVWSYERGTLQYDIICALILAFVFFVPPSCFVAKRSANPHPTYQNNKVASQNINVDVHR